ncbi:threonine ammonia-lyase [Micrococcus lacusdianchii]|uniref:threonine ammonia-lyase n=1 Tax=Micrococcus lacusdianchii TaxID=2915940 RepID=UPI002002E612
MSAPRIWARPSGAAGPATDGLGVRLEDVERAREVLDGVAETTPLQFSRALTRDLGTPVHLKCENLQRAGSFKVRGAYVRMAQLSAEERARGVVAASAGNHAQGVALAAAKLGIHARIVMPRGVALPKLQATRDHGAEVQLFGSTVDEVLAEARHYAERTGAVFIPPFDDPAIVAGQGTVGLEIMDALPAVDTVVVGIGGGGLIAGLAVAMKERARQQGRTVRVVGVQAATAAAYPVSLAEGRVQVLESVSTIADGIAVGRPGDLPFGIVAELVDAVVTVTDDEIAAAMVHLLERSKLVVEPAGAVGVAALLSGRVADLGQELGTTVAVLSGGNIDPMLLLKSVQSGLSAAGRYMTVRIPLPDRAGELATISRIIAETDANVVRVDHTRVGPELSMGGVHITIDMETKGWEHSDAVLTSLREAGYAPLRLT